MKKKKLQITIPVEEQFERFVKVVQTKEGITTDRIREAILSLEDEVNSLRAIIAPLSNTIAILEFFGRIKHTKGEKL